MNNPIDTIPVYISSNYPSVYSDYNQFDNEYTSIQIEPVETNTITTEDQKADMVKGISIAFFTLVIGVGILFIAYSIFTLKL